MQMRKDAADRLSVAFFTGFIVGAVFMAWTSNPLALPAGVALTTTIEVVQLAWAARIRRIRRAARMKARHHITHHTTYLPQTSLDHGENRVIDYEGITNQPTKEQT